MAKKGRVGKEGASLLRATNFHQQNHPTAYRLYTLWVQEILEKFLK